MLVISRNTAFTYRNKPVDTRQIGRELGVRYVLEGSVRRGANKIRVNAQLIDAEPDTHLWAEQFDYDMSDLFMLQNEVTRRIAATLNVELVAAEGARPTEHPDALDYILRGRAATTREASRQRFAEAVAWYERALAVDPSSIEPRAWLAQTLVWRVGVLMTDAAAADLERADRLIAEVLTASPHNPLAHLAKGALLRRHQRPENALFEFETAVASDRNWVEAIRGIAMCKFLTGSADEALPLFEQVLRLSPRDPRLAETHHFIGVVHLFQSRLDEAIPWYEKASRLNPMRASPHYHLAAAYGLKGDVARAGAELAEARIRDNTDLYTTIARVRANGDLNTPAVHAQFESVFLAGLRKAGMPEE
jgi:tetratricopeptide (TPR) repeat protein